MSACGGYSVAAQGWLQQALSNLQLRQYRRALECLLRAQADIQACDRADVEARDEKAKGGRG